MLRLPAHGPIRTVLSIATIAVPCAVVALTMVMWSRTHTLRPGIEGCANVRQAAARIDCYAEVANGWAREHGSAWAVGEMDIKAQEIPSLRKDCHLALHPLGEH